MGPQGNVLRGESLVLVVSANPNRMPGSDKHAALLTAEDWVTRINGQIARHLELRFNKSRFAGGASFDLFAPRRDVKNAIARSVAMKSFIDDYVRVTACPMIRTDTIGQIHCQKDCFSTLNGTPKVLILVKTEDDHRDVTRQMRYEKSLSDDTFVRCTSPTMQPCAYEFFRVKESANKGLRTVAERDAALPKPTSAHNAASDSMANDRQERPILAEAAAPCALPANDDDLYHLASRVCGALTEYPESRIKRTR